MPRPARSRRPAAGMRAKAARVLAQGATAAPRRAFGSQRASRKKSNGKKNGTGKLLKQGLNATMPLHLGLPRPVGPYTVIRTTQLHTSSARVILFTPLRTEDGAANQAPLWITACGLEDVNAALPINGDGNTNMIPMPLGSLGGAAEVVPAALTVQVMNQASLQNAGGLFAMCRINQQMQLGGETRTWNTLGNEIISFYRPRLLTGAKLALRGVISSAYPLNMQEFADFAGHVGSFANPVAWDTRIATAALSPIAFIQQSATPVDISFMVTIEWRVRFDPLNPATASHTFHQSLPDEAWNGIVGAASAMGHGVEDIVEGVANAGEAL